MVFITCRHFITEKDYRELGTQNFYQPQIRCMKLIFSLSEPFGGYSSVFYLPTIFSKKYPNCICYSRDMVINYTILVIGKSLFTPFDIKIWSKSIIPLWNVAAQLAKYKSHILANSSPLVATISSQCLRKFSLQQSNVFE